MPDWIASIDDWKRRFRCRVLPPVSKEVIAKLQQDVGTLPADLFSFYSICNGLYSEWFKVLPIEDPAHIKHTWDGIGRANDPNKTRFLNRDQSLLADFLVFASLDAGNCAAFRRSDETIWYQEEGELHQVDLSLAAFIETGLMEVRDL